MIGIYLYDFNCGFKVYCNVVVKSIEVYGDMYCYILVFVKWVGFKKIGEKVVQYQECKYGIIKFGIECFICGLLDLFLVIFIFKFGKWLMYFFGMWGVFIFVIGFFVVGYIGISKLYCLSQGLFMILVMDNFYFYIFFICMVIGMMLFFFGFFVELILCMVFDWNSYFIEWEIGLGKVMVE